MFLIVRKINKILVNKQILTGREKSREYDLLLFKVLICENVLFKECVFP